MTNELVETARRIAPELGETAAEDNALRRLSDRTWNILMDNGFLRSLQPARWGGGEVPLMEFVDATIELARVSPSAAWIAGVIGLHPWQLALFDERAQQEMWGKDPALMHSSSYNPTGKADKVAGGYKLSGRWSFSSGCDHCHGVMLGAICGTREVLGRPVPDFRSFLLLGDQYRIDDNWHVAGLKGTGSKDIIVESAFVPEYRSQSVVDYAMNAPLPGQERNNGPLYRLPWSVVFNTALAASVLGASRGFVDVWISQTRERKLSLGGRAADDALMQRRLAEAIWLIDVTITRLRTDIAELWQMAQDRAPVSMQLKAQVRWNMNRGCDLVAQAIDDLFRASTGRAVFVDHPLQQRFQDIEAAMAHAYLSPDPLAKAVGGYLLGTSQPEFSSKGAYLDRAIACIEHYTDESRHSALWERQRAQQRSIKQPERLIGSARPICFQQFGARAPRNALGHLCRGAGGESVVDTRAVFHFSLDSLTTQDYDSPKTKQSFARLSEIEDQVRVRRGKRSP